MQTKAITLALAAHQAAWPEGREAVQALRKWCEDEGVYQVRFRIEKGIAKGSNPQRASGSGW